MFYTQLLMLKDKVDDSIVNRFDKYLCSLSTSALQNISLQRTINNLSISDNEACELFKECESLGILKKCFVVRCPECDFLCYRYSSLQEIDIADVYCDSCEQSYEFGSDNIDVLFVFNKNKSFFELGQQSKQKGFDLASNSVGAHHLKRSKCHDP